MATKALGHEATKVTKADIRPTSASVSKRGSIWLTPTVMQQEQIEIAEGHSQLFTLGNLVVTVLSTGIQKATLIVGRPGMPNSEMNLGIGRATIFETPIGLFEVRLLHVSGIYTRVLVTEIAPRPGLAAGYVEQDVENAPFTPHEREKIAASLEQVRRQLSSRNDLSVEQFEFVSRKLVEMEAAAERLGRKDWINWVVGTLTSIVVTAAFEPSAAKALVTIAGTALSWVTGSSIKLLP